MIARAEFKYHSSRRDVDHVVRWWKSDKYLLGGYWLTFCGHKARWVSDQRERDRLCGHCQRSKLMPEFEAWLKEQTGRENGHRENGV